MADGKDNNVQTSVLTKKDLRKAYFNWHMWAESGHSFERMQGMALCRAFCDPLKKLYGDDKEGLKRALKRESQLFNTEALIGASVVGATLSMEESMMGEPEDEKDEAITSIKVGLMGPIAGIGDALDWTVFKPIFLGLACDMALKGSWIGALIAVLFVIGLYYEGRFMFNTGYRLGKRTFSKLLGSSIFQQVILLAGALGLFMMGALGASYVSLSTPLEITFSGQDPIVIQEALDSIVPGLLPLAVIFGVRGLMKKTSNFGLICIIMIVICMIGSFIGIF